MLGLGLLSAAYIQKRYLLRDPFGRADSALTLGSPDVGGVWTPVAGTFGISNGRAYSVTDASGDGQVSDTGKVNHALEATVRGQHATNYRVPMLVSKYVDGNNHLEVFVQDGTVRLQTAAAGSFNVRASTAVSVVDDTDYQLRVAVLGSVVTVYLNGGAALLTYTLTGGEATAFGAGTKVGIRLFKFGSPTINARWDDLAAWAT